jgi:hypothetical protein
MDPLFGVTEVVLGEIVVLIHKVSQSKIVNNATFLNEKDFEINLLV